MAPIKKETGSRPNRIRFVMLDADISDGNLSELTQAITSALKPNNVQIRQLPSRTPIPALPTGSPEDGAVPAEQPGESTEPVAALEEESSDGAAPKTSKSKGKPATPEYLHDLDLTGNNTSFKEYIDATAPRSQMKRYLASAQWLKEHGASPTVNIHKVYTCFKTAGWPVGINDWDAPFRSAVKANYMRRVSKGEYAINPLGENAIGKAEE